MKFLLLISSLILHYAVYSQTLGWSGYPAGGTSYTNGIMTATITSSSAGSTNGTPRYYSGGTVGSGQCGIAGGLALEQLFGNATSAHITLTIDFTSGNTTNGTCSSVSFKIKDINADESVQTFRDFVHISAVDGFNSAVPVANITATGGSNKTITTSGGTTRIIAGSSGSYGSRSQTACDEVTINVTPPAGIPLKRIVIRYQPSYEPCSGSTGYWNFSGPYRPAYEYISIGSLTLTATAGCEVLPVELRDFEGTCVNGRRDITWNTATEKNSSYFDLEQSSDGQTFSTLATLQSAGNSTELLRYGHTVVNDNGDYFRLKQVDMDGAFHYSNVIYISCIKEEIKIFPNPFLDEFTIDLRSFNEQELIDLQWFVSDYNGRKIISEADAVCREPGIIEINTRSLSAGSYILNITNTRTGEILKREKLIKR